MWQSSAVGDLRLSGRYFSHVLPTVDGSDLKVAGFQPVAGTYENPGKVSDMVGPGSCSLNLPCDDRDPQLNFTNMSSLRTEVTENCDKPKNAHVSFMWGGGLCSRNSRGFLWLLLFSHASPFLKKYLEDHFNNKTD